MWEKAHTLETKQAMSKSQKLRYLAINHLMFQLRDDQLDERTQKILHLCGNGR